MNAQTRTPAFFATIAPVVSQEFEDIVRFGCPEWTDEEVADLVNVMLHRMTVAEGADYYVRRLRRESAIDNVLLKIRLRALGVCLPELDALQ